MHPRQLDLNESPALALLRVLDLGDANLRKVLGHAVAMKREPRPWTRSLAPRTLVGLFALPSTRTRLAFATAAHELGMLPFFIDTAATQLSRGEPIHDTARSVSALGDVILARLRFHGQLAELAAAVNVPVVNALSDRHHPCEGVASLFTVREHFGTLEGLKFAYVGDGASNFAHSLVEAAALADVAISVAAPDGYKPDEKIVAEARAKADTRWDVLVLDDPREAVADANAVFTDAWVSMGNEAESEERKRALRSYRVDEGLMSEAASTAVFLHCLPAQRGEEVTSDVLEGERSLVWTQVANHRHVAKAILYALVRPR
jgi:ornithine carbamoyltransferase